MTGLVLATLAAGAMVGYPLAVIGYQLSRIANAMKRAPDA